MLIILRKVPSVVLIGSELTAVEHANPTAGSPKHDCCAHRLANALQSHSMLK